AETVALWTCPSDKIGWTPAGLASGTLLNLGRKRSYTVTSYNANPLGSPQTTVGGGWPPSSLSRTGIGLFRNQANAGNPVLWDDADQSTPFAANTQPRNQMSVRTGMVLASDSTLFMTEAHWDGRSICGRSTATGITVPSAVIQPALRQGATRVTSFEAWHAGTFNYLFTDGHVESLAYNNRVLLGSTNQSDNFAAGAFTINPND
ncbi:MAG: H-X9-DG-CTERM domain-containing protein, partial [Verrucomicrobiota bacterium]